MSDTPETDAPTCSTCRGRGFLLVRWPRVGGRAERSCPQCKGFGLRHNLLPNGIRSIICVQNHSHVYVTDEERKIAEDMRKKWEKASK